MTAIWLVIGALWLVILGAYAYVGFAKQPRPSKYEAELILEIRDEKLRIFQYETPTMICHISIIDVQMIGAQASVSCVAKNVEERGSRLQK